MPVTLVLHTACDKQWSLFIVHDCTVFIFSFHFNSQCQLPNNNNHPNNISAAFRKDSHMLFPMAMKWLGKTVKKINK